eukprot:TRINITY_DN7630_c0_g1_i3.p1 TRINITY_DN7630_c0_g1~~TRINITY_DN7630_c0_g1_i3.p1  ORF type:complete len:3481 (+),score=509.11 TRINITY_DN7630_c0_g1_i3:1191-10445(+)
MMKKLLFESASSVGVAIFLPWATFKVAAGQALSGFLSTITSFFKDFPADHRSVGIFITHFSEIHTLRLIIEPSSSIEALYDPAISWIAGVVDSAQNHDPVLIDFLRHTLQQLQLTKNWLSAQGGPLSPPGLAMIVNPLNPKELPLATRIINNIPGLHPTRLCASLPRQGIELLHQSCDRARKKFDDFLDAEHFAGALEVIVEMIRVDFELKTDNILYEDPSGWTINSTVGTLCNGIMRVRQRQREALRNCVASKNLSGAQSVLGEMVRLEDDVLQAIQQIARDQQRPSTVPTDYFPDWLPSNTEREIAGNQMRGVLEDLFPETQEINWHSFSQYVGVLAQLCEFTWHFPALVEIIIRAVQSFSTIKPVQLLEFDPAASDVALVDKVILSTVQSLQQVETAENALRLTESIFTQLSPQYLTQFGHHVRQSSQQDPAGHFLSVEAVITFDTAAHKEALLVGVRDKLVEIAGNVRNWLAAGLASSDGNAGNRLCAVGVGLLARAADSDTLDNFLLPVLESVQVKPGLFNQRRLRALLLEDIERAFQLPEDPLACSEEMDGHALREQVRRFLRVFGIVDAFKGAESCVEKAQSKILAQLQREVATLCDSFAIVLADPRSFLNRWNTQPISNAQECELVPPQPRTSSDRALVDSQNFEPLANRLGRLCFAISDLTHNAEPALPIVLSAHVKPTLAAFHRCVSANESRAFLNSRLDGAIRATLSLQALTTFSTKEEYIREDCVASFATMLRESHVQALAALDNVKTKMINIIQEMPEKTDSDFWVRHLETACEELQKIVWIDEGGTKHFVLPNDDISQAVETKQEAILTAIVAWHDGQTKRFERFIQEEHLTHELLSCYQEARPFEVSQLPKIYQRWSRNRVNKQALVPLSSKFIRFVTSVLDKRGGPSTRGKLLHQLKGLLDGFERAQLEISSDLDHDQSALLLALFERLQKRYDEESEHSEQALAKFTSCLAKEEETTSEDTWVQDLKQFDTEGRQEALNQMALRYNRGKKDIQFTIQHFLRRDREYRTSCALPLGAHVNFYSTLARVLEREGKLEGEFNILADLVLQPLREAKKQCEIYLSHRDFESAAQVYAPACELWNVVDRFFQVEGDTGTLPTLWKEGVESMLREAISSCKTLNADDIPEAIEKLQRLQHAAQKGEVLLCISLAPLVMQDLQEQIVRLRSALQAIQDKNAGAVGLYTALFDCLGRLTNALKSQTPDLDFARNEDIATIRSLQFPMAEKEAELVRRFCKNASGIVEKESPEITARTVSTLLCLQNMSEQWDHHPLAVTVLEEYRTTCEAAVVKLVSGISNGLNPRPNDPMTEMEQGLLPYLEGLQLLVCHTQVAARQLGELKVITVAIMRQLSADCLSKLQDAMKCYDPVENAKTFAYCSLAQDRLHGILEAFGRFKFLDQPTLEQLRLESKRIGDLVNEAFSDNFLRKDVVKGLIILETLFFESTGTRLIDPSRVDLLRDEVKRQTNHRSHLSRYTHIVEEECKRLLDDPCSNSSPLCAALKALWQKHEEHDLLEESWKEPLTALLKRVSHSLSSAFQAAFAALDIQRCTSILTTVTTLEENQFFREYCEELQSSLLRRGVCDVVTEIVTTNVKKLQSPADIDFDNLRAIWAFLPLMPPDEAKAVVQALEIPLARLLKGLFDTVRRCDEAPEEKLEWRHLENSIFDRIDRLADVRDIVSGGKELPGDEFVTEEQRRQWRESYTTFCRRLHSTVKNVFLWLSPHPSSSSNATVMNQLEHRCSMLLVQPAIEQDDIFTKFDALHRLETCLRQPANSELLRNAKLTSQYEALLNSAQDELSRLSGDVQQLLTQTQSKLQPDVSSAKAVFQTVQRYLRFPEVTTRVQKDLERYLGGTMISLQECVKSTVAFILQGDTPEPSIGFTQLYKIIRDLAACEKDPKWLNFLQRSLSDDLEDPSLVTNPSDSLIADLKGAVGSVLQLWCGRGIVEWCFTEREKASADVRHFVRVLASARGTIYPQNHEIFTQQIPELFLRICSQLFDNLLRLWSDSDKGRRTIFAVDFRDLWNFTTVLLEAVGAYDSALRNQLTSTPGRALFADIIRAVEHSLLAELEMITKLQSPAEIDRDLNEIASCLVQVRTCCNEATMLTPAVERCLDSALAHVDKISATDPKLIPNLYTCLCISSAGSAVTQRPCFKDLELSGLNEVASRHTPETTVNDKLKFDPDISDDERRQLICRLEAHNQASQTLLLEAAGKTQPTQTLEVRHTEGLSYLRKLTLNAAVEARQACSNDAIASLVTHVSTTFTWVCSGETFLKSSDRTKLVQAHNIQIGAVCRLLELEAMTTKSDQLRQLLQCQEKSQQSGQVVRFNRGHMIEILTGEGKSITLGILACTLALLGLPVHVVCYNSYLSRRDEESLAGLVKALQLKDKVHYMTFHEVIEKRIGSLREVMIQAARGQPGSVSPPPFEPRVLLVDEVDVFFDFDNFFGQAYKPVARLSSPAIQALIDYVFSVKDDPENLGRLFQTRQFQLVASEMNTFVEVLYEMTAAMVRDVKCFGKRTLQPTGCKYDYVVDQQKGIGYFDSDGTINFALSYGFKSAFALCAESAGISLTNTLVEHRKSIPLPAPPFSFIQLPTRDYMAVFGVTGTLRTLPPAESRILSGLCLVSKRTYTSSVYERVGELYNITRDTTWKPSETDWRVCIAHCIDHIQDRPRTDKGWPVVVVWEDSTNLQKFLHTEGKKWARTCFIIDRTVPTEEIKNKVDNATQAGRITMMTREFGRGLDFKCRQCENLTVIQTFLSYSESEETQIRGRTGRQGQAGTYRLIVCAPHVQRILQLNPLSPLNIAELEKRFCTPDPTDECFVLRHERLQKSALLLAQEQHNCNQLESSDKEAWAFAELMFGKSAVPVKQQALLQCVRRVFPTPQNYVMILDHSGSMRVTLRSGQTRWVALVASAERTLQKLRTTCNPHRTMVTLIFFNTNTTVVRSLLCDVLPDALANVQPNGGTNFAVAFRTCAAVLRQLATSQRWDNRLLFLTDGEDDSHPAKHICEMFHPEPMGVTSCHRILFGTEVSAAAPVLQEMSKAFAENNIIVQDMMAGDETGLVHAMEAFACASSPER